MKVAIGSDERTHLTDVVIDDLRKRGYEVETIGPLAGQVAYWPDVAIEVGKRVASGTADEGILFCWTGTGVSIAANKIPGVRAALCWDAETARGAKKWDGANVLVHVSALYLGDRGQRDLGRLAQHSRDRSHRGRQHREGQKSG